MFRGRTSKKTISSFRLWSFITLITAMLYSCNVIPTQVITPKVTECPPSGDVNIYKPTATPSPIATFPSDIPTPTPLASGNSIEQFSISKQEAFQNLEAEVRAWTDIRPFVLDDTSQAWVILTFLSPELIKVISVNEELYENPNNPAIQPRIEYLMKQIANREKLIFLLTMISGSTTGSAAAPHTIRLTAGQMILNTSSGLSISPGLYDHNLDQPIALTESNFGYLYYPLSINDANNVCTEVLSPTFNTKIIVQTESIIIDKSANGPYTWTIDYKPLLDVGLPHPADGNQNTYPESTLTPSLTPPTTLNTSTLFWQEYAKFVWGQLTR